MIDEYIKGTLSDLQPYYLYTITYIILPYAISSLLASQNIKLLWLL